MEFAVRTRRIRRGLCSLCVLLVICTSAFGEPFALKDGDTVVFYGDSITAQRLYTRFVEDFVLTRYPDLHIRFVNAGVPGDTALGGYTGTMAQRVQRDVQPFHPSMIAVMMGMNDGGWGQESPKVDASFEKGYRELLAALHTSAPDATLTLIRPSPYDEITHGTEFPHYSRVIDDLASDVSRMAAEMREQGDKVYLADFHQPLIDALQKAQTQSPELAPLIVPDRIHPLETGHWIMAAQLVSAWHIDPVVSSLELGASDATVHSRHRASVANLRKTAAGLEWSETDEALPLPLDLNSAMISLLVHISNIAAVDRQQLKVDGLEAGHYQLLIDNKPIASFSNDELQTGVNLALLKTPMVEQAQDIEYTQEQRMRLDQARFILSADIKSDPQTSAAEDELRRAQDELGAQIRQKLRPTRHSFELKRL
jgi:lysophospholipase L1-like esterase